MSEKEQMTQESGDTTGGTALKALAGAAAGGAATYAVRKALASRNGHDDRNADEHEGDEVSAEGNTSDEQAESEPDDAEYAGDEDEPEGSAEDDDLDDGEESDGDDEDQDAPEGSADEEDEDDDSEDDDSAETNGADGSSGKGSLRQLVNPSRLASLSHLVLPLAGEAADSAGRYVAEHTSNEVQQQVVDRFIDAFEKAS
jgi:hypothetical protein